MKSNSIWLDGIDNSNYPKLNKNIDVDVLIIGGGITGISTAYHLINSSLKVALVERNKIGEGVTARTTGKLTYLQDNIYTKLNDEYTFEVARLYYESQKDAIKIVKDIVNQNKIDCDYTKQTSYLFTKNKDGINKIKREEELLIKMGANVKEINIPLDIHNYYSISVFDTAYFHPVKYLKSLAKICYKKGISIYENSGVTNIIKKDGYYECTVNNNIINAEKIVIASHYPFFLHPFFFPIKGYLEKSYIGASKSNSKDISGITIDKNIYSFRFYKDNYIELNNTHDLAFKFNEKDNFKDLINKNLEYIWSNTDIITNDYLPYIGLIDNNLYIGTGYNTWGMTNGSLAGKILSDLIKQKDNKYKSLFNPKRSKSLISYLNIFKDIFYSAKPFIQNKVVKNKSYYSSNVIFTKINNKDIGIYIDDNKKEHIVYNKCPHIGCSLIFNEVEHTWDCPCHSSRFGLDGKCIAGPSKKDITF